MPPVAAAGAAILSIGIGTVTVGSILLNIAVGMAINAVAGLFIKKPSTSGASIDSGLNVTTVDPNAPFPFVLGRTMFGGVRRFHELSDNNRWLHCTNVYAAHVIDAVEQILVNGEEVNVDADGWAIGTYAGVLRIKVYLGTPDQQADPYLLANAPSYTAAMRGRGLAYAAISAKWDTDLFPQEPNVQLVMRGAKAYDPRDDAQQLDNPATWKWTNNAILLTAHYMRGMPKPDHTGGLRYLFGTNAKDVSINWNEIAAEANICDEPVALASRGYQKRYTCNGILLANTDPEEGLNQLLTACAGMRTDTGGKLSLRAWAARTPELSFDMGDLIGPIEVSVKRPLSQVFNGVKGQYRGPDTNYEPDDAPVFIDESLVALDGRENWMEATLPFTDNAAAAQRIQRLALSENRRQISMVAPMKLRAMRLKAGDWFRFTSLSRGWDEKLFRIKRWKFAVVDGGGAPYFGIEVEAEEVDTGIDAWSTDMQHIVPPPPSTNLPNPLIVTAPTMNEPEVLEFRDRALMRLSATAASEGPPVKFRFEYRVRGEPSWTVLADRDEPVVDVFLDVGDYEARVRTLAQPFGGRSPYAPVDGPLQFKVGAPPLTPRVTGLELVGGGSDGTFTGRDAIFQWRQGRVGAIGLDNPLGADVDQQDPYFAGYRLEVRTRPMPGYPSGMLMRDATITDTRFEYTFEMNYRDAMRIGLRGAQRAFRLTVLQIGRYGGDNEYSLPLSIDVENPAPGVPFDLNIRTLFSELRVSFTPEPDPDFEGAIIWASLEDGFDPASVTPLFVGRGNLLTFELDTNLTWYVRMAAYDAFIGEYDATDVSLLNLSAQVEVQTSSLVVDIPTFSFIGFNVRPNSGRTGVDWDSGTASVKRDNGVTQYAVSSGSAAWTSGSLYIFYREGQSTLQTATSLAGAQFADSYVLAIYRGGTQLTVGDGNVYTDGATIIAGTISAQQLVTGSAVITQGAQIASAIIGDAHINDLSANKLKANTGIVNKLFVGADELIEIDGASGAQRITFYENV